MCLEVPVGTFGRAADTEPGQVAPSGAHSWVVIGGWCSIIMAAVVLVVLVINAYKIDYYKKNTRVWFTFNAKHAKQTTLTADLPNNLSDQIYYLFLFPS